MRVIGVSMVGVAVARLLGNSPISRLAWAESYGLRAVQSGIAPSPICYPAVVRPWPSPRKTMRRRDFIAGLAGSAATWPGTARAQQPAMPVIGLLRSTPAQPFAHLVSALRQGLAEMGFVEGQNFAIEARNADNRLERLPDMAADLIGRKVAAIVVNGAA